MEQRRGARTRRFPGRGGRQVEGVWAQVARIANGQLQDGVPATGEVPRTLTPPAATLKTSTGAYYRIYVRGTDRAGNLPADPNFTVGGLRFNVDPTTPTTTMPITKPYRVAKPRFSL